MAHAMNTLDANVTRDEDHVEVDASAAKYALKLRQYLLNDDQKNVYKYRWLMGTHDSVDADKRMEAAQYYEDKQDRIRQEIRAYQKRMKKVYNKTKAYLALSKKLKRCRDPSDGGHFCEDLMQGTDADRCIQDYDQNSNKSTYLQGKYETSNLLKAQKQAAALTRFSPEHFDLIKNQRRRHLLFEALQSVAECRDMQDRLEMKSEKCQLLEQAVLNHDAQAAARYAEMHGLKSYELQNAIVDCERSYCKAKAKGIAWKLSDAVMRQYEPAR